MNLFPEIKTTIQDVLRSDSQLKNADVELQQRAVEYLRLSTIASTDILVGIKIFFLLLCRTLQLCLLSISKLH